MKTILTILMFLNFLGQSAQAGPVLVFQATTLNENTSIQTILNTRFETFENPECLRDYVRSNDYHLRLTTGGKIEAIHSGIVLESSVNVANVAFSIRFNQNGGENRSQTAYVICLLSRR